MPLPHLVRTQAWPGVGQFQPSDSVGRRSRRSSRRCSRRRRWRCRRRTPRCRPSSRRRSGRPCTRRRPRRPSRVRPGTSACSRRPGACCRRRSLAVVDHLVATAGDRLAGRAVSGVALAGAASGNTKPERPPRAPLPRGAATAAGACGRGTAAARHPGPVPRIIGRCCRQPTPAPPPPAPSRTRGRRQLLGHGSSSGDGGRRCGATSF
jgi:hypothetical protein